MEEVVNLIKNLYFKTVYFCLVLLVYGLYVDINFSNRSIRIHFLQIWKIEYNTKQLKFLHGKKNKELIKNLSQTISKELKKPNGGNKKLIDTLQKILDKAS